MDYNKMTLEEKRKALFSKPQHVNPETVQYKINADFVSLYTYEECYRELMVSYFPMLPLLEKTVEFKEADYILYMHMYARCEDLSDWVVNQLQEIAKRRKDGAEIIVLGKAANAEKLLNGSISNITFWGDHFTEKLGQKFGFDIKEEYFVWDDEDKHLAIWPVDGCMQKCKFCRRSYMHIKFESLSLDTIERELDSIKTHTPDRLHTISLRAENLTEYGIDIYGKPMLHKLLELLEKYEEIKYIEMPIGVSIGEITPEILDAICKSTKMKFIAMNLETGTNRLLNLIGKKHTCEQAISIFKKLRKTNPNIIISSTIMLGLPTETLDDIYELAFLIGSTSPDFLLCNYYICTPRQPLANLPQLSDSLREYHLKLFLKLLRYTLQRDLDLECWRIYKKRHSRQFVKSSIENKQNMSNGFLPRHKITYVKYTYINK